MDDDWKIVKHYGNGRVMAIDVIHNCDHSPIGDIILETATIFLGEVMKCSVCGSSPTPAFYERLDNERKQMVWPLEQ